MEGGGAVTKLPSLARTGELTLTSFSGWGLTLRLLSTGRGVTLTLARASLGKAELEVLPSPGPWPEPLAPTGSAAGGRARRAADTVPRGAAHHV